LLLDFIATFFASGHGAAADFRAGQSCTSAPRGYGWLYAAPSVGAVVGGIISRRTTVGSHRAPRQSRAAWFRRAYGARTVVFGKSPATSRLTACSGSPLRAAVRQP
jgi:hypothetical protein